MRIYNPKTQTSFKVKKSLYNALANVVAEDQIGEFYESYFDYIHAPSLAVIDVVKGIMAFSELLISETCLDELNKNTDKDGNIDWPKLLEPYTDSSSEVKVIYK